MGKHKYTVSIHIGRGSGRPNHYFDRFNLFSDEYDDHEQFCEAMASKLLEKIEADEEYRESVQGV